MECSAWAHSGLMPADLLLTTFCYHLDGRGGMRLSHFRTNPVANSLILATAAVAVLSAALWAARAASRLRTLSNASIGVLGFTMRSFLRLRLGEMGCVFSRVNTSRRSMSPHSNHSSVWCSKPETNIVASCIICLTYTSAAHIKHRIATALFQRVMRRTHPSCISFEDVLARTASRQAAPPLSHVYLRSADMETAPSSTRCGRGSRHQRKFEGQSAVGSQRTSQRDYASDRSQLSKKRGQLPRSLFAA